jgi:hypothetical protein
MEKFFVNREQYNPSEELSIQVQAALTGVTREFVKRLARGSSLRLCAVMGLSEQSINGQPDVMSDLCPGRQTPELMIHARQAEPVSLESFVGESRELFAGLLSGDSPRCSGEWITQSFSTIWMLSSEMQECLEMTPGDWEQRLASVSETPIVCHPIFVIEL